ncbi:Calcium-regulated actin-bundling protein C-terminal domain-containing protein [Entamoeba marina]
MSLTDEERTKLQNLAGKKYKEQAIWFLNAYWLEGGEAEAEKVWDYCNKFGEFDPENHAEGCSLDELNIHRILEFYSMHKTIQEFRESLRSQQFEFKKLFALCVFLAWNYKMPLKKLINAPQGAQSAEMQKAQQLLEEVQKMLDEALKMAKDAAEREKELAQAEKEVAKALAELKKQEDEFNNKTNTLKATVEKETGVVKKNRAQAELAQHLESDPLPLRKAKTTTEAAKRKAEKALKSAQEARQEADDAVDRTKKRLQEAEEYLEQQKAAAAAGQGLMWWMSRELEEKKKFMPMKKGGVAKK